MYKPQSRLQIFLSKLTGEPVSQKVSGPKTKEESYLDDMSVTIRPKEFYFYEVDGVLRPFKSLIPMEPATEKDVMDAYMNRGVVFRTCGATGSGFVAGLRAYVPVGYSFEQSDGDVVVSYVAILDENNRLQDIVPYADK